MQSRPIRVFADNGRWWLVSVSAQTFTDVSVDAVDRVGKRTRIDALSAAELPSLEQLSVLPPASLDPAERTLLDVQWHDRRGQTSSYAVSVPNDGMRAERPAADLDAV